MDDKRIGLDLPWLTAEESSDYILGNLLAILNRDGGHCQSDHGLESAVRKALEDYYDLREKADALEAAQRENAELRAALGEAVKAAALDANRFGEDIVVVGRHEGWEYATPDCPHLAAWLRQQEVKGIG